MLDDTGLVLVYATANIYLAPTVLAARLKRIYRAICFFVGATDLQNGRNIGQSKRFQRLISPALAVIDVLLADGIPPEAGVTSLPVSVEEVEQRVLIPQ